LCADWHRLQMINDGLNNSSLLVYINYLKEFLQSSSYMNLLYFDQIKPPYCLFLPLLFFSSFGGFHYAIFIYRQNVFWYYSIPSLFCCISSLHFALSPKQSHNCIHVIFIGTRCHIYEKTCYIFISESCLFYLA
jgi:hypothetical protein